MAAERVEVVVAPRSFDRSGSGGITGPIWLHHAARDAARVAFPEQGWTDFPVVVLGWWLGELGSLARHEIGEATCRFMDGPFQFTVAAVGRTLVRVRWVGQYVDDDRLVAEFLAPAEALCESMDAAAAATLAECDRRGWTDRDIDNLRRAASRPCYVA